MTGMLLIPFLSLEKPYMTEGVNCSADIRVCGDALLCERGVCRECEFDRECIEFVGAEHACLPYNRYHRICAHKHLLPPDMRDLVSIFLTVLLCAIAAGGGIGGGGLLLPLFILVLAFTPHDASPLANVTVLGGSIANLSFYHRRRHPSGRRALISYEVALMMEPMTMAGALAGVLLNKIFPGWLITTLLVVILGLTTHRTLTKGLAMWRKETAALANPNAAQSLLAAQEETQAAEAKLAAAAASARYAPSPQATTPLSRLVLEERGYPRHDVGVLVLAIFTCILLSMLRGPNYQHSPLRMHCGSGAYWVSIAMQLGTLLLISTYTRSLLLRRHADRIAAQYPFLSDDVQWTPSTSVLYPLACAVAGLCAGLFGIGGGIIKGPLMLEMGMLPQVASATSAFMILFTSAAATIQYVPESIHSP